MKPQDVGFPKDVERAIVRSALQRAEAIWDERLPDKPPARTPIATALVVAMNAWLQSIEQHSTPLLRFMQGGVVTALVIIDCELRRRELQEP